jgi:hypothetical protein
MNGHRKLQRLLPVAALFTLAACGQGTGSAGTGDEAVTAEEDRVYQGQIIVFQGIERDSAELCVVVMESYPPQCEGLPVTGWEWDAVEHEEASGVRWGTYVVTGTFDGKAFTVTEDAEDPGATEELGGTDDVPDPAEDLSPEEIEAAATELQEQFPQLVFGHLPDDEHGVAVIDALLVSAELEAYAAEHFPEDTIVFRPALALLE